MALFNEILVGRFNAVLNKLLEIKSGAPAPTLSSDITPGITLESDRPEWHFLGGSFRCAARTTRAADAANRSFVGIFNGQLTGMLAVVDSVIINNPTAGAIAFALRIGNTTGLSNTIRGNPLDLRWRTKASACLVGDGIEAASTGQLLAVYTLAAGTAALIPLGIVLPPNEGQTPVPNLVVSSGANNVAVDAAFIWRERVMEPSENR